MHCDVDFLHPGLSESNTHSARALCGLAYIRAGYVRPHSYIYFYQHTLFSMAFFWAPSSPSVVMNPKSRLK